MPPEEPRSAPRRAARLGLLLAGLTVVIGAGGAAWFFRAARAVRRDPGAVYRDRATLDKLLKRASDAEQAGDRATAIATYRFVVAVGEGKEAEQEGQAGPEWARYAAAARAGLRRLGVADTLRGRRH